VPNVMQMLCMRSNAAEFGIVPTAYATSERTTAGNKSNQWCATCDAIYFVMFGTEPRGTDWCTRTCNTYCEDNVVVYAAVCDIWSDYIKCIR
jgi:hypothetical protein